MKNKTVLIIRVGTQQDECDFSGWGLSQALVEELDQGVEALFKKYHGREIPPTIGGGYNQKLIKVDYTLMGEGYEYGGSGKFEPDAEGVLNAVEGCDDIGIYVVSHRDEYYGGMGSLGGVTGGELGSAIEGLGIAISDIRVISCFSAGDKNKADFEQFCAAFNKSPKKPVIVGYRYPVYITASGAKASQANYNEKDPPKIPHKKLPEKNKYKIRYTYEGGKWNGAKIGSVPIE